jgi:hypothetical protein
MNRRLSMLCLVLLLAGAVLFAAGAWAGEEVSFSLTETGLSYVSGPMLHYPILDITVKADVTQPAPFGIVREEAQFQLDASTRAVSDLRIAFVTADGDWLYGHGGTGQLYPDPQAPDDPNRFQSVMTVDYVGGTGIFAGVRGTGTSVARHAHLSPVLVTIEDAVISGTLQFADSQPNMVPVKFSEGALVGDLIVEPESFPLVLQEVTHSGLASHGGTYLNAKRLLVELDPVTMSPRNIWGFFTKTFANGDTVEGYVEGTAVPSTLYEGASEVSLQVWMFCGTGRFDHATGYDNGSGTTWPDGREMLTFEGVMSSVGSSMD